MLIELIVKINVLINCHVNQSNDPTQNMRL